MNHLNSAPKIKLNNQDTPFITNGLIAATGLFFTLLVFYPGWMSPDSIAQYQQAITKEFSDWHPVLMASWWGLLIEITPGPFLLFFQNQLMLWLALYFFSLGLFTKSKVLSISVFLVGVFPPFLITSVMTWKDVSTSVSFLLIFSYIFFINRTKAEIPRWGIFPLVLLAVWGVGVKPNSIVLVPVLVAYFFYATQRNVFSKRYLFTTIGIIIFLFLSIWGTGKATNSEHSAQYQVTLVGDLLAIEAKTGERYFPKYISQTLSELGNPEYQYSVPDNNDFFALSDNLIQKGGTGEISELQGRWINAVTNQPIAYLEHRLKLTASLLRVGYTEARSAVSEVYINDYPNLVTAREAGFKLSAEIKSIHFLWYPWISFMILMLPIFIAVIVRKTLSADFWYLALSGFVFFLPYILISPAADYRYLLFTMLSFSVAALIGLSDLQENKERFSL